MYKLSEHFTLEEMYSSYSAKKRGINNIPTAEAQKTITKLVTEVLEPIRQKWNAPLLVSSGYRCPKLNFTVGGSKTSDHLIGAAADIQTKSRNVAENKKLFDLIVEMTKNKEIKCRQIIDEHNYRWIHVSINDKQTNIKHNEILHIK